MSEGKIYVVSKWFEDKWPTMGPVSHRSHGLITTDKAAAEAFIAKHPDSEYEITECDDGEEHPML